MNRNTSDTTADTINDTTADNTINDTTADTINDTTADTINDTTADTINDTTADNTINDTTANNNDMNYSGSTAKTRANSISVFPGAMNHYFSSLPHNSFQGNQKIQRQRSLSFMDHRSMAQLGLNPSHPYNPYSSSPLAFDFSSGLGSNVNLLDMDLNSAMNALNADHNLNSLKVDMNTLNTSMNIAENSNTTETTSSNGLLHNYLIKGTTLPNETHSNSIASNSSMIPNISMLNQSQYPSPAINPSTVHNSPIPFKKQDFYNDVFPPQQAQSLLSQSLTQSIPQQYNSMQISPPFQQMDLFHQPLNPDNTRRYSLNNHAIVMRRMERKTSCASDSFLGHRPHSLSHSSLPGTFSTSPFAFPDLSPAVANHLETPQSPFVNNINAPQSPFAANGNYMGGVLMENFNDTYLATAPASPFAANTISSQQNSSHQNQAFPSSLEIVPGSTNHIYSNSVSNIPEQSTYISPNLLNEMEMNQNRKMSHPDSSTSLATSALLGIANDVEKSSVMIPRTKAAQSKSTNSFSSKKEKKIYNCNIGNCSKTFSKLSSLQEHALSHSADYAHAKVKPFICPICDQTFSRSHDLKRHSYMHDQVKPYVCERCHRGFSRRDALLRHDAAFLEGRKVHCFQPNERVDPSPPPPQVVDVAEAASFN